MMSTTSKVVACSVAAAGIAAAMLFMCGPDDADASHAINGSHLGAYQNAPNCVVAPFLGAGAYTHCLAAYEMQGNDFAPSGNLLAVNEWSNLGLQTPVTNDSGLCFSSSQVTYDTTCDAPAPGRCILMQIANGDAATPCQMDWDAASAGATSSLVTQRTLSAEIQEKPGVLHQPPLAIEVQWQFPNGPGSWPYAMATYTSECQTPNLNAAFGNGFAGVGSCVYRNAGYAETDMNERQGPNHSFDFAVHASTCNDTSGTVFANSPADFGVGWHTSVTVFNWAPNLADGGVVFGSTDFYVDGALVTSIPENDGGPGIGAGCGNAGGYNGRFPLFYSMGLNFGGQNGGAWSVTDLPQSARIRYVRIACHWDGTKCVK